MVLKERPSKELSILVGRLCSLNNGGNSGQIALGRDECRSELEPGGVIRGGVDDLCGRLHVILVFERWPNRYMKRDVRVYGAT